MTKQSGSGRHLAAPAQQQLQQQPNAMIGTDVDLLERKPSPPNYLSRELFNPGRFPRYLALLPPPNGCPTQHHTGTAHSRSEVGLIETERAPNSSRRQSLVDSRRGALLLAPPSL